MGRTDAERREIRRELGNCRALRARVKLYGMAHGQAVARGFGSALYRDGLLAHVRMCRRSLNNIRIRWKMYRVLRDAAKESM